MATSVLVTGGAGFIGSHVVDDLVRAGYRVTVFDNFSSGLRENLAALDGDVEIVEGNVLDAQALQAAARGKEIVSHQAAQLEITKCLDDPLDDMRTNLVGTINVLEAARAAGASRVVNASSACIYGQAVNPPSDEDAGVRQVLFAAYQLPLLQALAGSTDPEVAGIAAKGVKEVRYHLEHAAGWVIRLGDGTDESHRRTQAALDALWTYTGRTLRVRRGRPGRRRHRLRRGPGDGPRRVGAHDRHRADRGDPRATHRRAPNGHGSARRAQRTSRLSARGDAVPAPTAPRSGVVTASTVPGRPTVPTGGVTGRRDRAWTAAAAVTDPEIPVLTIADLGILRDVLLTGEGAVEVVITPTYSGCPAMDTIRVDLEQALAAAGFPRVAVRTVHSPAWTTDWMTQDGRRKLAEFGIAPPSHRAPTGPVALTLGRRRAIEVRCPQCGARGREQNRFGSTSCKALYVCTSCSEPFDYFKAI